MSAPSEKHMEKAVALRNAVNWQSNGSIVTIATALANAERDGMKRAAEIARGHSGDFDFQSALAECRDTEVGFHNGKNAAARLILSEAGEA